MNVLFLSSCVLLTFYECKSAKIISLDDQDLIYGFDYRLLPREKRNDQYQYEITHNDKQRPKNYHYSVPLPTPFNVKDSSFTREKRKQPEKVLRAPLYFSYNKQEDPDIEATNDEEINYEDYEDSDHAGKQL